MPSAGDRCLQRSLKYFVVPNLTDRSVGGGKISRPTAFTEKHILEGVGERFFVRPYRGTKTNWGEKGQGRGAREGQRGVLGPIEKDLADDESQTQTKRGNAGTLTKIKELLFNW